VRAPEAASDGTARATLSFDAWKGKPVASSEIDIPLLRVAPRAEPAVPVSPQLRATFNRFYEEAVWSVAFTPDSKTVAAVGVKGTTKLLDARTAQEIAGWTSGASRSSAEDTYRLAMAPDGQTLAISHCLQKRTRVQEPGKRREVRLGYSGEVQLWDMKARQPRTTLRMEPGHGISRIAYAPDGIMLAVLDYWRAKNSAQNIESRIALWDVRSGKMRSALPFSGNFAFSPDGKTLAVGSLPPSIVETATGKELAKLPVDDKRGLTGLAFSPDGRTLAGSDFNGHIYAWDVNRQVLRATRTVAGAKPHVFALAISPDGQTVAVAGFEEAKPNASRADDFKPDDYKPVKIELWNLATMERCQTLVGPPGLIYSLAYSPDGRILASGGFGNVMLWEPARR
jgi:WD40 repeat protein